MVVAIIYLRSSRRKEALTVRVEINCGRMELSLRVNCGRTEPGFVPSGHPKIARHFNAG